MHTVRDCAYTPGVGASRVYPLRLPDEMRVRWQAEADALGVTLAEFVKQTVEAAVARRSSRESGAVEPSAPPIPRVSAAPLFPPAGDLGGPAKPNWKPGTKP